MFIVPSTIRPWSVPTCLRLLLTTDAPNDSASITLTSLSEMFLSLAMLIVSELKILSL